MTIKELEQRLVEARESGMDDDTPITIQLPDMEPPVDFWLDFFDTDMANIFPKPPNGGWWKTETNKNEYT